MAFLACVRLEEREISDRGWERAGIGHALPSPCNNWEDGISQSLFTKWGKPRQTQVMVELVGAHRHSVLRVGCSEVREAQVINSLSGLA